jgi:hypothetical protein
VSSAFWFPSRVAWSILFRFAIAPQPDLDRDERREDRRSNAMYGGVTMTNGATVAERAPCGVGTRSSRSRSSAFAKCASHAR